MALNAQGLGVTASWIDDGLQKGIAGTKKAFASLGTTLTGIAGIGLSALTKMPDTGPLRSLIKNVAADYKISTTQVEAFGVAADRVSSAALAGLNMNGRELAKAKGQLGGIAYGLNMDIGSVTQSFKALKQANIDVTKVGFKSFTEFQKFVTVTGVDAEKLAFSMKRMRSQFRMSDKDIKDTLESVVALGKRFNVGSEAAGGMAAAVNALADEGAQMWAELGPEKSKKFLEGTQKLGIAFMNAGHSAQEAQDLAIGVGRAMLKGQKGVQELYSGLQDDLPEAAESLTEQFGSFDKAFQKLQDDPAAFTKGLAIAAKKIRDSAKSPQEAQMKLARFSGQMEKSFGPQFAALVGGSLDETIKSFKDVDDASKNLAKSKSISSIADQYRDGLTYQQKLARAQDQFRDSMKRMKGVETDAQFLNRFNVSAKEMKGHLEKIVAGGGPLGKMTSMMIELANHGLGGVLSKLTPLGPALTVLIQDFGPVLQYLPAIKAAFMGLMNPIGLAAAAIAGLYFYFRDAEKGGGKFKSFIDGLIPKIVEIGKKVFSFAAEMLPKIGTAILDLFHKIDWNAVGNFVYDMGKAAWGLFLKALDVLADLGKMLVQMFERINWGHVADILVSAVETLAKKVFEAFKYIIKEFPKIALAIAKFLGEALWRFIKDLPAIVKGIYDIIIGSFVAIGKAIVDILNAAWEKVKGFASDAWDSITDFFSGSDDPVQKQMQIWIGASEQAADATAGAAKTSMFKIMAAQSQAMIGVQIVAKQTASLVADSLAQGTYALDGVEARMKAKVSNIEKTVMKTIEDINKAGAEAKMGATKDAAVAAAAKEMGVSTEDAAELIKAVAGMSPAEIKRSVNSIKDTYVGFLKEVTKTSQKLLTESRTYFTSFLNEQKDFLANDAKTVFGGFVAIATGIMQKMWADLINMASIQARVLTSTMNGIFRTVGTGVSAAIMNTGGSIMSGNASAMEPSAAQNPLDTMVSSINNPTWTKDHLKQQEKIIDRLDLLVELSHRKGQVGTSRGELLRTIENGTDNTE